MQGAKGVLVLVGVVVVAFLGFLGYVAYGPSLLNRSPDAPLPVMGKPAKGGAASSSPKDQAIESGAHIQLALLQYVGAHQSKWPDTLDAQTLGRDLRDPNDLKNFVYEKPKNLKFSKITKEEIGYIKVGDEHYVLYADGSKAWVKGK